MSLNSCFSQTWNFAVAFFCVPLFSIVWLSFNQTTAQSNHASPFTGSKAITALLLIRRRSTSIFFRINCWLWSTSGSFIRSRNLSGIDSCTMGHMLALGIILKVTGSVIFPKEDKFAAAVDMWVCASLRWSNSDMILSINTCDSFFSWTNFETTSVPNGISSSGSISATWSTSMLCLNVRYLISLMVLITTSTSWSHLFELGGDAPLQGVHHWEQHIFMIF